MLINVTVTQPVGPLAKVFASFSNEVQIHPGYVVQSWLKPSGMAVTEALDQEARDAFWNAWTKAWRDQVCSS